MWDTMDNLACALKIWNDGDGDWDSIAIANLQGTGKRKNNLERESGNLGRTQGLPQILAKTEIADTWNESARLD